MIDVIVPIYNAYDEVHDCIRSLLAHSGVDASFILIDDASTDFRIQALMGELALLNDTRLTLLRNDMNLGFVQTVNRGLVLSHNDVVLLNSDTVVPPLWLERLEQCAVSRQRVGTVTPFSNNAEICSYPVFCENTLVDRLDTSELEQAMASQNDGTFPEIPTAVGFCMYIRRELINAIGLLDADRFGQGYGEENDFCMRATAAGFAHLLCTSAFVVHKGSRSFLGETRELKERNLKVLLDLHPDYSERIARFIAEDPLGPYRDRVASQLASRGKNALGLPMGPGLLLITHRYGGGVDKHVMDLVHMLNTSVRVEILRPFGLNGVALDDSLGNRRLFDAERWDELVDVLRHRAYASAHLHHTHGYPAQILKLPAVLGIPYDVTLHDFGVFCPQYSLTTAESSYCGEPDIAGCDQCLRQRPHQWDLSIVEWRERMATVLAHAQRVISPSAYVSAKVKRRFPAIAVETRAHPPRQEWLEPPSPCTKVLVLGGLSRAKGLTALLACAWQAKYHGLSLTFAVVGYPERSLPLHPALPLHITGEYADGDLPELVANERADCIWFPGQNPESYSYTLDVALACGLPIVASRALGAVAERLLERNAANQLVEASLSADELNQVFLNLPHAAPDQHWEQSTATARATREAYCTWLLSGLPRVPAGGWPQIVPVSALRSNMPMSAIVHPSSMSLSSLYEQAVDCGHLESRGALRQQIRLIESEREALASVAERAGKPWYLHIEAMEDRSKALHAQALDLAEQNHHLHHSVALLQGEVETRQGALAQSAVTIQAHETTIFHLNHLQREQARLAEEEKRGLVQAAQRREREMQEASEDLRRAFAQATARRELEMQQATETLRLELSLAAQARETELQQAAQARESELHQAAQVVRLELTQSAEARQRELIQYYEQSNSWLLTAPLRALRSSMALNVHRMGYRFRLVQRGLQRWPMAFKILREQGPGALFERVHQRLTPPAPPVPRKIETSQEAIGALSLQTCPTGVRPHVSIVIPVYGQHQFTYNCLASIAQHTVLDAVEVIVIDDASPEPAAQALAGVTGVQWISNPVNLGFIGSCNAAAQQATGEYLVLLNNDVQVTAGWLDALLAVFALRGDAGLVGARLVYPDGRLQEAGGIVWQDGSAWNWGRDQNPEYPAYRYLRPADYCSGACLAIRKSDWVALDGFDRAYMPAYYEDTDLAFRIRAMGKSVYYQPEALVIHHEGVTSGTDESKGMKRHQVTNQVTFFERWKPTLASHRANGVQPWAEVNRKAKRRVLVVEACMITPDQDSGSVRMLAILELLTELSVQVSFVADNLEYRQPYVQMLQQKGVEVWHHPHIQSVAQLLEMNGGYYDAIIFCRHYIATQYLDVVRQLAPKAKIWFDTVDLHYLREERLAALQQSSQLAEVAAATRKQELAVIQNSDLTFVVSPVEMDVLALAAPDSKVAILSNIHEPLAKTPGFKERHGLLFVGGFQHPPNVDAVQWFIGQVWPLLRAMLPEASLKIVGSKMPESLRDLQQPGIDILGFVQDIDPLLLSCKISIAPLRYGAGVKGKVNQAMSFGLPVVATPAAVEGMNLSHGRNAMVADTPKAFAEAIVQLHADEALWNTLVAGGKANVLQSFSRDVARNTLSSLLALD